jgi:adenylosuccinate synthase
LTGLEKVKICVGYKTENGDVTDAVPSNMKTLSRCQPIYEEMDGWTEDIGNARDISELPRNARRYIERLESLTDSRLVLVSVGPGRNETIILKNPFFS